MGSQTTTEVTADFSKERLTKLHTYNRDKERILIINENSRLRYKVLRPENLSGRDEYPLSE